MLIVTGNVAGTQHALRFLHRCRWFGSFPPSPAGASRPADVVILPGSFSPQVLTADGFDGQRDRCRHDPHTAVCVSPQAAGGPTLGAGAPDGRVHPDHRGCLQCIWHLLFGETATGRAVGSTP